MKHTIAFFFFLLCSWASAQELLPFVENFTKSNYNGDNQVWSVAQGSDNAFYFANNHYLLRYNGVRWEKYSLPNKTIIRSVFSDGDKIYSGSYNEFGYWIRKNGTLHYTSLTKGKNFFRGLSINEEIWKIFKHDNKIYFQSFNDLYVLENTTIRKIRIPFQVSYCFLVEDKIYAASVKDGVFLFENNKFTKIEKWNLLENNIIHAIDKAKNKMFFFTQKNGVYYEENNTLKPWLHPINELLKKETIITAKAISNNRLVIGTAFQGVYVVNLNDNSYNNISRKNALKNNSILSIGTDKENDLWLGLDNGISHIEINSSYKIFSDNTGILGSVYTMAPLNNGLLLGSNHGVFKYQNKELTLLPNSQGQVWDILKVKDKYLIGHNDGTYIYENNDLKKVNSISGGWKFLKSNFHDAYFLANYSGIVIYENPNDFQNFKRFSNLTKPIKNIIQNKENELWAVDNYRSLYRLLFDEDFKVKKVENITQKNKILNDYGVKMVSFNNEVLFYINSKWYNYNAISDKLELNTYFNNSFANISELISIDDENFIVLKEKSLFLINRVNNKFVWNLIPEKYYEGKIINQDSKVFKVGSQILLNLDDGFFAFELQKSKFKPNKNSVRVEAMVDGVFIERSATIGHNKSINLDIISEFYGNSKQELFYTLDDTKDFNSLKNSNIVLNNLSSGSHELVIYYNDGENYVQLSSFNFRVDMPWYISIWMILIYLSIIGGAFYLYYKWNKIRYIEKLKLKEEELKHQKEILKLEMDAQSKLKLQEYEKHILEVQIQAKASEVAGKSLSIAKQSEMIESIQKALETENDMSNLKSSIKKSIKINAINKNEWQSFEKNLLQSNEEFVQRLTKKYPVLTSKDIKLCIYLRMNLSSKEIAPLMNISFRGVELHRYRLRKKIGLTADDSLSKFMINI
ncbi:helix-turn-helix and ligand-binding sensor domain-containing protein [Flavobacterium dankookense]|uniref:helix-turn-helix and ligand-binding sensor domain-containing protein n=1 Tax=Flavobacterium dankookense TaxID=706186 RepID=UPI00105C9B3F|nr:histidine kinase [Flavobacterium dankookense]